MCAALSLCVHAPKSPLIPFICTAGIRIEDRSSKRGFELSSFYQPMLCPPSRYIYARTNRSFRSFFDFLKDIAVPNVVDTAIHRTVQHRKRTLFNFSEKRKNRRDDRLKEKSELNFTFFSKIFLKKMQKRKKKQKQNRIWKRQCQAISPNEIVFSIGWRGGKKVKRRTCE